MSNQMKRCPYCGLFIESDAKYCKHCNNRGDFNGAYSVPEDIDKFNWAAFICPFFWSMFNGCFAKVLLILLLSSCIIGLIVTLCIILKFPYLGWILAAVLVLCLGIYLGKNGNIWAWQGKKFKSHKSFHNYQKLWIVIGIVICSLVNIPFVSLNNYVEENMQVYTPRPINPVTLHYIKNLNHGKFYANAQYREKTVIFIDMPDSKSSFQTKFQNSIKQYAKNPNWNKYYYFGRFPYSAKYSNKNVPIGQKSFLNDCYPAFCVIDFKHGVIYSAKKNENIYSHFNSDKYINDVLSHFRK